MRVCRKHTRDLVRVRRKHSTRRGRPPHALPPPSQGPGGTAGPGDTARGETLIWVETPIWVETLIWAETPIWVETLIWAETPIWVETPTPLTGLDAKVYRPEQEEDADRGGGMRPDHQELRLALGLKRIGQLVWDRVGGARMVGLWWISMGGAGRGWWGCGG